MTYHMCLDIRGFLKNHTANRYYENMFRHDDGRLMTASEAKDRLLDELAKGKSKIPLGDCEGFNYETGCPGHQDEAP